jgi:hypothetical protein
VEDLRLDIASYIRSVSAYNTKLPPPSNLVAKSLVGDLLHVLVLPLPLLALLQTKSVLENLANLLQVHSLDIWVEQDDEQPSDEADSAVESESTAWGNSLHHREESGRDDDVGRPAGNGVEHSSQGADLEGNELGADPGNGRDTGGEHGDVDNDGNENYGCC